MESLAHLLLRCLDLYKQQLSRQYSLRQLKNANCATMTFLINLFKLSKATWYRLLLVYYLFTTKVRHTVVITVNSLIQLQVNASHVRASTPTVQLVISKTASFAKLVISTIHQSLTIPQVYRKGLAF